MSDPFKFGNCVTTGTVRTPWQNTQPGGPIGGGFSSYGQDGWGFSAPASGWPRRTGMPMPGAWSPPTPWGFGFGPMTGAGGWGGAAWSRNRPVNVLGFMRATGPQAMQGPPEVAQAVAELSRLALMSAWTPQGQITTEDAARVLKDLQSTGDPEATRAVAAAALQHLQMDEAARDLFATALSMPPGPLSALVQAFQLEVSPEGTKIDEQELNMMLETLRGDGEIDEGEKQTLSQLLEGTELTEGAQTLLQQVMKPEGDEAETDPSISFEPIDLGHTNFGRGCSTSGPAAQLFRTEEELKAILPEGATVPEGIDFRTQMVVGIRDETRPTGGYGIDVQRILPDSDGDGTSVWKLEFSRTEPEPNDAVTQAFTVPTQFVVVPRTDVDRLVWSEVP